MIALQICVTAVQISVVITMVPIHVSNNEMK